MSNSYRPLHIPGDPTLPPGCTQAMIDKHFGPEKHLCEFCESGPEDVRFYQGQWLCAECCAMIESDQ